LIAEYQPEIDTILEEIKDQLTARGVNLLDGAVDNLGGELVLDALKNILTDAIEDMSDIYINKDIIEKAVRDLSEKVISGEIGAEEAKAEVAKTVNGVITSFADTIEAYIKDTVYQQTLDALDDQSVADILKQATGNSAYADLIEQITKAQEEDSLLAKFENEDYKNAVITAITDKDLDCNTLSDENKKADCEAGKAILADMEQGLAEDASQLATDKTNLELVKSALGAIATLTTAINPDLTAEERTFLASFLNPDGSLVSDETIKADTNFTAAVNVEKSTLTTETNELKTRQNCLNDNPSGCLANAKETIKATGKINKTTAKSLCDTLSDSSTRLFPSPKSACNTAVNFLGDTINLSSLPDSIRDTAIDWLVETEKTLLNGDANTPGSVAYRQKQIDDNLQTIAEQNVLNTIKNLKTKKDNYEKAQEDYQNYLDTTISSLPDLVQEGIKAVIGDPLFNEIKEQSINTTIAEMTTAIEEAQVAVKSTQCALGISSPDIVIGGQTKTCNDLDLTAFDTPEKIVAEIISSHTATLKSHDVLGGIIEGAIKQLKEEMAQTAGESAGKATKEAFNAIAQPIADQIIEITTTIIDEIANLVEEVKDTVEEVINNDTVQCFAANISTLKTAGENLVAKTTALSAHQATIKDIVALAQETATYLTSLQEVQDLNALEAKVDEFKTLINAANINLEAVKAFQQELKETKDIIEQLPCLSQLSSPAVKALQETIDALETMINPLDTLLSPNARLSDYLYALADATQAIADFIEEAQKAANKVGAMIDRINDVLPAPLPTLQNPLAPIIQQVKNLDTVQEALEQIADITDAAGAFVEKIEIWIEKTALPAITDLITDVKNIDRAALEATLTTHITALLANLENEAKKLPPILRQFFNDHKDEVTERIEGTLHTVINSLPTEEDIKQAIEKAKTAITQAQLDLITYLQENALPAPTFSTCTSETFTTTGDKLTLPLQGINKAEEVRGYLAVLTNTSGEQLLYVLPSTGTVDFELVTIATGDYTIEIRTLGKDALLHTAPIYDFFLALDLTKSKEDILAQISTHLTNLQNAGTNEWNNLNPQIKAFLTFLGNKLIHALPDEARTLLQQGLSEIQSALKTVDTGITTLQNNIIAKGQSAYGNRNVIEGNLATSILTLLEKAEGDSNILGALLNDKNTCTIKKEAPATNDNTGGGTSGGSNGGSNSGGSYGG
jgi:hypothetical protein